jgi:hypothetical protein
MTPDFAADIIAKYFDLRIFQEERAPKGMRSGGYWDRQIQYSFDFNLSDDIIDLIRYVQPDAIPSDESEASNKIPDFKWDVLKSAIDKWNTTSPYSNYWKLDSPCTWAIIDTIPQWSLFGYFYPPAPVQQRKYFCRISVWTREKK